MNNKTQVDEAYGKVVKKTNIGDKTRDKWRHRRIATLIEMMHECRSFPKGGLIDVYFVELRALIQEEYPDIRRAGCWSGTGV